MICGLGPPQSKILAAPMLWTGWTAKRKIWSHTKNEKLCFLAQDEVQISKRVQYDSGLMQFVGFLNPKNSMEKILQLKLVMCFVT